MTDRAFIFARVEQICAEIVHQNGNDCSMTLGAKLGADLQFDELDVLEAILACEEQFRVELPDEDVTTQSLVSDLVGIVASALRDKDGKPPADPGQCRVGKDPA